MEVIHQDQISICLDYCAQEEAESMLVKEIVMYNHTWCKGYCNKQQKRWNNK